MDAMSPEVGQWFQKYQQRYEWPDGSNRKKSEKEIDRLACLTQNAIRNGNTRKLQTALVEIHRWKNGPRNTSRYENALEARGQAYIAELLKLCRSGGIEGIEAILRHLCKVDQCNLPTASAMASFLFERRDVPIIDRYVAAFFAHRLQIPGVDSATSSVLKITEKIEFKMREGRNAKLGLAVYSDRDFEANLRKYVGKFLPECRRLAANLAQGGFTYDSIDNNPTRFNAVDVEMAIFSWAKEKSVGFKME